MIHFTDLHLYKIKKELGVAAIEFVFLLPLLLILTFSVIDFGRLLFQYDTLTKNTRVAARFLASVVRPPAAALLTDANYTTAVNSSRNLALCGTITICGTISIVGNLVPNNIIIDYPAPTGNITYVRIMVRGYSTNYVTRVLGLSQALDDISVTMRQVHQ